MAAVKQLLLIHCSGGPFREGQAQKFVACRVNTRRQGKTVKVLPLWVSKL